VGFLKKLDGFLYPYFRRCGKEYSAYGINGRIYEVGSFDIWSIILHEVDNKAKEIMEFNFGPYSRYNRPIEMDKYYRYFSF